MNWIQAACVTLLSLGTGRIMGLELDNSDAMVDRVMIVKVQYATEIPMNYLSRIEYSLRVLEVLHGLDMQEGEYLVFSSFSLPFSFIGEEEDTVRESHPLIRPGPGFRVEEGDTVIALTCSFPRDGSTPAKVVFLEPMENLDALISILEDAFHEE